MSIEYQKGYIAAYSGLPDATEEVVEAVGKMFAQIACEEDDVPDYAIGVSWALRWKNDARSLLTRLASAPPNKETTKGDQGSSRTTLERIAALCDMASAMDPPLSVADYDILASLCRAAAKS